MILLKQIIDEELQKLERRKLQMETLQNKLDAHTTSKLTAKVDKGHFYYTMHVHIDGTDNEYEPTYIGRKDARVQKIQFAKFIEKYVEIADNNISLLKEMLAKLLSTELADVVMALPSVYQEVDISMFSRIDEHGKKWLKSKEEFKTRHPHPNPVPEENEVLPGFYVRSKTEMIIAILLITLGIAFIYECPIEISPGHFIYPDFTIYVNGKIYIWHHLGDFYSFDYFEKYFYQIRALKDKGFILNENMFITIEKENGKVSVVTIHNTIDMILKDAYEKPLDDEIDKYLARTTLNAAHVPMGADTVTA